MVTDPQLYELVRTALVAVVVVAVLLVLQGFDRRLRALERQALIDEARRES